MSARVIVLCGPAGSGKTARLLLCYRRALQTSRPGSTLWLSPTWRAAAEVRSRLLDEEFSACFEPRIMTFFHFAASVLQQAGIPIRPISKQMKHSLLRELLQQQLAAGRLNHFRPIADTAGMVELLADLISEWKRLEIWPEAFHQACSSRGMSEKDRELFELYDAYQQALREHRLYDAEGAFWSARDVLQKSLTSASATPQCAAADEATRPINNLFPALVVADGFTDFTHTQHEILALLAQAAAELYVSLPLESPLRRKDLFFKPQQTLAELRRRHVEAIIEELPPPSDSAWPALNHLERTLFLNPRELTTISAPEPAGIEILAAARQIGEIEQIAARIKRLLVDGEARPSEIVVVFRSLEEVSELIREVFGRLGIPVAIETGWSLECSRGLRALAGLLELDLEDWTFEQVLGVLSSNYFQPEWPEWRSGGPAVIERAVRCLQVPYGRRQLMDELAAAQSAGNNRFSATAIGQVGDFVAALAVIRRLASALDALPQQASLPDWAKAWQTLAQTTGLLRAMSSDSGEVSEEAAAIDRRAWDRLQDVLKESDLLERRLNQAPPLLDRREAYRTLLEIMASERLDSEEDEAGRVRVLTVESIRTLYVPYLFLAGLAEKYFPLPEREDRLYSESEYAQLIAAGLPLPAHGERIRGEMMLFYEALTRAGRKLVLSYPAFDEKAQPLLPSPFLDEVEAAFGARRILRYEETDLSPLPRGDEPLCEAEFRVGAVARSLKGDVKLLAGLCQRDQAEERAFAPSAAIAAGLELIHLRQERNKFSPAEGILQSAAARQVLESIFPPQYYWSVTELERYASCPFRFLLERILHIEPVEEPALESDYLGRGRIVHEALAYFHRRVNALLGRPGSPLELDAAAYEALLQEALERSLPPRPSLPWDAALWEVDRRVVAGFLDQYRTQLEDYAASWKDFEQPFVPVMFEVSFGRKDADPPSTAKPLQLRAGNETVHLAGRIDRVDIGRMAGQTVFNVLDYKSGSEISLKPEMILTGCCLQPPLYALAVQTLLLADQKMLPYQAGYWFLRTQGYKPKRSLTMHRLENGRLQPDQTWISLQAELGGIVAGLVRNIRGGRFPVFSDDPDCTGNCPYHTVCRINQIRALEKTFSVVDEE